MFKPRLAVGGDHVAMEIGQHIAALERDGELLAQAAEAAGLDAPVPACPGWRVRDLVRHQAYVHRWAMRHIIEQPADVIEEATEAEVLCGGLPDHALIAAYLAGHAALVRVLREADPDVRYATFMDTAPTPLGFWARRQAHETAIHRFDAQSAAGTPDPVKAFAPGFAADGVDELIMGFAARRKYRMPDGAGTSLSLRAADVGETWCVLLRDGITEVRREADRPAGCTLDGPAAGLYAFLWNRCDLASATVTAAGDPAVLDAWRSGVRVRWD
jgi:uncharacterized protein (TIGR03083 family)